MEYLLSCECGHDHVVSKSQAGQDIKCSCGKNLLVPTLRGLVKLPLAQNAPVQAQTKRATDSHNKDPDHSTGWQGWRGPTIALISAVFMIATISGAWYALQRFGIDTSYTADVEIEAGAELLDAYDPNQLSLVWESFSSLGLRSKQRPEFFLWNQYAEDREMRAKICATVAAVSGLLAAGIWVSTKRRK